MSMARVDSGKPPGRRQKKRSAMMISALLDSTLSTSGGRSSMEAKRQDWRWMPAAQRNSRRTGTVTASMASHHSSQRSKPVDSRLSRTTNRSTNEAVTETADSRPKKTSVDSRRWRRTSEVRRPSSRSRREPASRTRARASVPFASGSSWVLMEPACPP